MHAMVWVSDDGITWERIPCDPDVFGSFEDGYFMYSVAAGPNGYLATGIGTGGQGIVWTSPDGRQWAISSVADIELGSWVRSRLGDPSLSPPEAESSSSPTTVRGGVSLSRSQTAVSSRTSEESPAALSS